jgi:alkyl hydroperoxide reductase subunit AhpC
MLADKASEQYRTYVIGYADTVSSKLLADYATFNLNVEGDFYHIQQYLAAQNAAGRHSVFTDYLDAQILLVGDPFLRYEAEDFKMATYTGDSVSLSSLRGKVVYLYIWSSYCGMSRMENERLATWYDAHPDSKVAILSYSIDVDERLWRKAIEEDSLHWPHQVMGMFEWTSPEIQQFGVRNIPVSFLLDAKGIIRSKAIHASELDRDYDKIVAQWGAK